MSIMIIVIIVLILQIKPIDFFQKKKIDDNAQYLLLMFQVNNRINSYYEEEHIFPKSLKTILDLDKDSLKNLFKYTRKNNNYTLMSKRTILDTFIIITKDSIRKICNEK